MMVNQGVGRLRGRLRRVSVLPRLQQVAFGGGQYGEQSHRLRGIIGDAVQQRGELGSHA